MKGTTAGKGDLRKMMRSALAQKKQEKKISSPLVRYNALGQPVCRLCEVTVKDEALWDAHVASKQHKQAILELKKQKEAQSAPAASAGFKKPTQAPAAAPSFKSPQAPMPTTSTPKGASTTAQEPSKKEKAPSLLVGYGEEEEEEADGSEGAQAPPPSPATSAKRKAQDMAHPSSATLPPSSSSPSSALPAGFFESVADVPSPNKKQKAQPTADEPQTNKKSAVPADFFDSPSPAGPTTTQVVIEAQAKSSGDPESKGELPTGFFDDPNKDTLMRAQTVAQKPTLEDEWEKFQATMSQVAEDEEKKKRESEALASFEDAGIDDDDESEENEEDEEISLEFQRKEERLSQLQELRQKKLTLLRQRLGAPHDASSEHMDVEAKQEEGAAKAEEEDQEEEDDDEDDDNDDEDEYDWRAKLL